MSTNVPNTVDQYMDALPETARGPLEQVRAAIRKALPRAEESISYNIPTYKSGGRPVIYFAGWKQHYSLYPVTQGLIAEFGGELASFEVNKGTIRFRLTDRVPVKLIGRIAKFRGREVEEEGRIRAKAAAKTRAARTAKRERRQSPL